MMITSPIYYSKISLFATFILILLSKSNSHSPFVGKTDSFVDKYHTSKQKNTKEVTIDVDYSEDGLFSQRRLPFLSSCRGGHLKTLLDKYEDYRINDCSEQKSTIVDQPITQLMRDKPNMSNATINTSQKDLFPAAMIAPDDRKYSCIYIAEADLPTDIGHFRMRAYRVADNGGEVGGGMQKNQWLGMEPCVIYCKDKPVCSNEGKNVPIRVHDQCFTSEVLGSKRCDCKEQLDMALKYIKKNGGAIIYLQQEGRGIGIANKVAAYALQDIGFDTVDANIHLGFPEDCRQYGVVPSILHDMGIASIQLITNNPRKLDRLADLGVDVQGTIPMVVEKTNLYNQKYLQTKKDRMNHSNFANLLSKDKDVISSNFDGEIHSSSPGVNMKRNSMMRPRR